MKRAREMNRQAEHPRIGRRHTALQNAGGPLHTTQLDRIHDQLSQMPLKFAAADLVILLLPRKRAYSHRIDIVEDCFDQMH